MESGKNSRPTWFSWWLGLLAIVLTSCGLWSLARGSDGLVTTTLSIGSIPVTVFQPKDPATRPVVVIAHGFAGSQQMMQPLARTLARNGYAAVTFDFAGHGRNAKPLEGGIVDLDKSTRALLTEIDEVATFSRGAPFSDGRLALVGHSMASELVVRYAMEHPNVVAVVAMSLFGKDVTPSSPRDLLVVTGAWEPSMLTEAAKRIVTSAAGPDAGQRVTYGDLAAGTARRYALARGAEHIGVIYSRYGLTETLAWMNAVFGRSGDGFIDMRGKWLALLFLGLVGLAPALARWLPVASEVPLGAGLSWRRLALVGLAPALLTPLLLWKAPTDFLPILLGDYLVVHFAVYGLIALAALWGAGGVDFRAWKPSRAMLAAAVCLAFYHVVLVGWPVDAFVTSFMPSGVRWTLIPPMFVGVGLFFLVDEWATRGEGARWGAYTFSKFCFVVSLAIAVALNPARLFFLVIIVPVIVVLFVFYGIVNRSVYRRVGDPKAGALGSAFGLAWAICVTFPIVS